MESIEITRKPARKSREDFLRELEEQHAQAIDRAIRSGSLKRENHVIVKSFDEKDEPGIAKRISRYEDELRQILRDADRK